MSEIVREYIVKSKDSPILRFEYIDHWGGHPQDSYYRIDVKEIYPENSALFPKGVDITNEEGLTN